MKHFTLKALKQNKGLSLVELMFVIAIISLFASVAILTFMNAKKRQNQQLLGNHTTQVEQANNSVTINGDTYYKEKIIPDTITLDGIEYKRVR